MCKMVLNDAYTCKPIKTEIACLSLDATSLDVVKMLVQMNRIMRLQQRSIEFQVIKNHIGVRFHIKSILSLLQTIMRK